jgi:CHAT domain-containing protein
MVMAEEEKASPTQWWGIHIAVSLNLSALKLYRAALDYQHEALQLVVPTGSPIYISRSQQYLGLTYGALRQFDLALENIQRAYQQGVARGGERIGQNIMAKAAIGLADLYRLSGDTQRALVAYDESSKLYQGLDFAHYNYAAHKGKFLSYLAQKNDALASEELLIVLRLFDEYREKILEERQKNFFFDREQDTYDLAIDFAYSRMGDEHRAFDYSETSRARSLLELMRRGSGSASAVPLTTAEIQQQMPEQVQIVQYAMLESKLLIWLVTKSRNIVTKSVDVKSSNLAEMLATAVKQIRTRDENAAKTSLKKLYDLLIEPIAAELDPNLVICFVPDKNLHYLPFSALVSRSDRYLVQDYRVMIAPSATILIDSTHKARTRSLDQEEQLLAVGNPTFDRSTNPNLSDLTEAEREVEQIAKQYRSRNVLPGTQATRKSITTGLAKAQVAHFAGHYVIDARSNLSSKLLLAPEPGERAGAQAPGLNSGDIYQMELPHTKLVVLAACQTGIEQQLSGEGPIGFARSFLVAGVPVVVASLWPVDSTATAELMILFHRFRKLGGLSITEALRRAQQEIMNREDYNRSYYWAAFTVIGGYSDY